MTEAALRGLFDHAGMFPPAAKSFGEALRDAARFPATLKRPEMVGADMVMPFQEWAGLTPDALRAAGFASGRVFRVAVVGVPLADAADAAEVVGRHNRSTFGRSAPVVSLEVHFEGPVGDVSLTGLRSKANGATLFVEPKWDAAAWGAGLDGLCSVLRRDGAGLKFRCAGATAVDRATLVAIVESAARHRIPLKATQGLHHPVPSAGHPHGFLGLLAALRLRQAHGPAFGHVAEALSESDARAFRLGDGIAWREWTVPASSLLRLPAFSIGSCSLEEPDAELAAAFPVRAVAAK